MEGESSLSCRASVAELEATGMTPLLLNVLCVLSRPIEHPLMRQHECSAQVGCRQGSSCPTEYPREIVVSSFGGSTTVSIGSALRQELHHWVYFMPLGIPQRVATNIRLVNTSPGDNAPF